MPARSFQHFTAIGLPARLEEPGSFNWRFRVPDGEAIEFDDGNLGPQRFVAGRDFGDFVVWRRDGIPSYQLACVADDAAMSITEVVRGEDLLKSTARQILLNRALGFEPPAWFHCRLVVDSNGRRLAKRHDALSLRALRQRGVGQPSRRFCGPSACHLCRIKRAVLQLADQAWRNSSSVFITIGPYQATGSSSGWPDTSRKRMPSGPA